MTLILYLLDHNASIAGAESTEIPDADDDWSMQTYNSACMLQDHNTLVHHMWICNKMLFKTVVPLRN